jgi:hypothetical protein
MKLFNSNFLRSMTSTSTMDSLTTQINSKGTCAILLGLFLANDIMGLRAAAVASMANNRAAFARATIAHITAANAAILPFQQLQENRKPVKRIGCKPYEREAGHLQADLAKMSFGLVGDYRAYGSSDGEWRKVPTTKRRLIIPIGVSPRRSRRLNPN